MVRQTQKIPTMLLTILAIAFVVIAFIVFAGQKMVDYMQLQKQVVRLQKENQQLAEDNLHLQQEITKLSSDTSYLEEIARKEQGLILKTEKIFDFTEPKK